MKTFLPILLLAAALQGALADDPFARSPSTAAEFEDQVLEHWEDRVEWHRQRFPWQSTKLRCAFIQTAIWLRAVRQTFREEDLDPHAFGTIEHWFQQNLELLADQKNVADNKAWTRWLDRHEKLLEEWSRFPKIPVKRAGDQSLAVAIRGFVMKPGVHRSKTPLTLKQSLRLAGGLYPDGDASRVVLYRNAVATTYNLRSPEYKDVPLLPGDMIVVRASAASCFSAADMDPFATDNPEKAPAVSENEPRVMAWNSRDVNYGPFLRQSESGAPPERRVVAKVSVLPPNLRKAGADALKKFRQNLEKGGNAEACFDDLMSAHAGSWWVCLEAARILRQHDKDALAIRILSDLANDESRHIHSRREYAWLLWQTGFRQSALDILRTLSRDNPRNVATRLDLIRCTRTQQTNADMASAYQRFIADAVDSAPGVDPQSVVFALTERNGWCHAVARPSKPTPPFLSQTENLSADIRCVVYVSNPGSFVRLVMREPLGWSAIVRNPSPIGGRFFSSYCIREYMLRRAVPGTYTLVCSAERPVTLQIALYTHWGTRRQTCRWTTVQLEPSQPNAAVARYWIELPE